MAVPKRRPMRWKRKDYIMELPRDGLEINSVNHARFISRRARSFSIFEADNICVELDSEKYGRRYHTVSVLGKVGRANASKTRKINGYKERIKGR